MNSALEAMQVLQKEMAGEAERSGLIGDDEVQRAVLAEKQAAIRLLSELSKGTESLRKEGGLTIDEAFEEVEK